MTPQHIILIEAAGSSPAVCFGRILGMNGMFSSRSRVLVVGTSGAGKSVLAGRLAARFGLTDIELDALFWEA